jgi:hypothetical protein
MATELSKALDVYRFPFMRAAARDVCRIALENGVHTHAFLVKANADATATQIKYALTHRYPVYFGEPKTELYKGDYKIRLIPEARFGICGPVLALKDGDLDHFRPDKNWVLHVWGPNLESTHTEDYALLEGGMNIPEYAERCHELYTSVRTAAEEVSKRNGGVDVHIRMPKIGQGAFIGSVEDPKLKALLRSLHSWALSAAFWTSRFKVDLMDREGDFPAPLSPNIRVVEGGDLFDVPLRADGSINLVVNAWDNASFIGNGGARDPTIDGWMASGVGPGGRFVNSSYTHNVFFAKQLKDPKNWVYSK